MALLMPTPEEGLQSGLTEGPDSSKKDFSGGSTLYSWAGVKTVGQNLWDKYSCKGGYFAGGWDLGSMVMLYGVTIFIPPAFLKASGGNPNGEREGHLPKEFRIRAAYGGSPACLLYRS